MKRLRFGSKAAVEVPVDSVVGNIAESPIGDVRVAVREALQHPHGYPDVSKMTIPEDRVAIVLESGQPQAASIVAGIVDELLRARIDPGNIVVLRSKSDAIHSKASPLKLLSPPLQESIRCVVHDPGDREMLCYLGPAADDSPIYVNRQIAEADVVIPVGTVRHTRALGEMGVHGIVVPHFADEQTLRRFFQPRSSLSKQEQQKRRTEAEEIAWKLGTRMTLLIVPGNGDNVQHIFAGDAQVVEKMGNDISEKMWHVRVKKRADLVVAAIGGSRSEQTWENLARTIRTAVEFVEPDGTIAICSELSIRPGSALRKLAGADSLELARRQIKKDKSADALVAMELIRAMQTAKVFLLSKMDEETVEDLGVGFISDPAEVTRLVRRHESCISVENAQRVYASPVDETAGAKEMTQ